VGNDHGGDRRRDRHGCCRVRPAFCQASWL